MKYIYLILSNTFIVLSVFANNVSSEEIAKLEVINDRQLQAYNNGIECFKKTNNKKDAIDCAISMDQSFTTKTERSIFGISKLLKNINWSNNTKSDLLVMLYAEKKYLEDVRMCLPLSNTYSQLAYCKGPLAFPSKKRNNFVKSYPNMVKNGVFIYKSETSKPKSNIFQISSIKLVKDLPNLIELKIMFQYLNETLPKGKTFVGFLNVDNQERSFYTTSLRQLKSGLNIGTIEIYLEDNIKDSVQTNNLILDFGFSKEGEVSYVFTKKIPYKKNWFLIDK